MSIQVNKVIKKPFPVQQVVVIGQDTHIVVCDIMCLTCCGCSLYLLGCIIEHMQCYMVVDVLMCLG